MKKLSVIFAMVLIAITATAQTKSAGFYDIIKLLAADSTSATATTDWKTGAAATSPIKWETPTPQKTPIGYIKNGTTNMSFAGGKANRCNVSLEGKTLAGFTVVQLSTDPPMINNEASYTLEKLLGKNNYKAKLLKTEEDIYPIYNYELKMPGKKTVWIIMFAGNMGGRESESISLEIIMLFDRKEFDRRTQQ